MILDVASGETAEAQRREESQWRQKVEEWASLLVMHHLKGEGENMQTDSAVNDTPQMAVNTMNNYPNRRGFCQELNENG